MNKIISKLVVLGIILLVLTGCTTHKAYTFAVKTGDNIKVKLKTNDGYDITSDVPFSIKKDNKTLSNGIFITIDSYDTYVSNAKNDSKANIIETSSKGDIEYVFYSYSNTDDNEWNYIIKVKDSKTGLIIGNPNSEKEAKEVFDRLTITKE